MSVETKPQTFVFRIVSRLGFQIFHIWYTMDSVKQIFLFYVI